MRQFTTCTIFFLLLLGATISHAQRFTNLETNTYRYLAIDGQLPKNLTSSRSIVVVKTDLAMLKDGSWREQGAALHEYLQKIKIDAVAYFYHEDLLAGRPATSAFINLLNQRQVENLLFFDYFPDTTANDYRLIVTKYNESPSLVDMGQPAWQTSGDDLAGMVANLGKDIIRADLKTENFLITDQPEYFDDINVIEKRKFPVYTTDIRIEKLAVPLFDSIPENEISKYPAAIQQEIRAYNAEISAKNQALRDIMQMYPYEYDIIPYREDKRFFFSNGFQFVLQHLSARALAIRKMLNYDLDRNETDYIAVRNEPGGPKTKRMPVEQPVYKFYIEHALSGNVYIGDTWDAAADWQEAMKNYLINNLEYAKKY